MIRKAVVAGQFYPMDKEELANDLNEMIPDAAEKVNAIGAVVPHAGYIYSGCVAGEVYGRLSPRDVYVILSPNHTGSGARFASSESLWQTPLGFIDVDRDIVESIIKKLIL